MSTPFTKGELVCFKDELVSFIHACDIHNGTVIRCIPTKWLLDYFVIIGIYTDIKPWSYNSADCKLMHGNGMVIYSCQKYLSRV